TWLARRRNHIVAPDELSGRGIERCDPVTHAAVAAGGADDDLVLDHKRGRRELHVGLIIKIGFPNDLTVLLVGRDHPRRIARYGDDQVAPQGGAAVRQRYLLLMRIHGPKHAAKVAGPRVDLVEHAPLVGDIKE